MKVLLFGRKSACAGFLDFLIEREHEVVGVITDSHLDGSPTAARARELDLPLYDLEEVITKAKNGDLAFDLGVSIVYWRRIPQDVISIAHRGIINLHPAPLPEYKGTAGYNLAILEGLSEWEVTAHYIDASIDTGPIIEAKAIAVDPTRETAQSLEEKSMAALGELAKSVLDQVDGCPDRHLETRPNAGGRYVSRIEMEAMKKIRPGDDVDRKIRAFWFPPYAGATIDVDGKSYTLVSEEILATLGAGNTSLRSSASERRS